MDETFEKRQEAAIEPIVDVTWLLDHLDEPDLKIVDARQYGYYMMGHLPEAISVEVNAIQLGDSSPQRLTAFFARAQDALRRAGIRAADRVVFYEDFSGTAAALGVWLLDVVGHRKGAMLDGGLRSWMNAGGPISRDVPDVTPSLFEITPDLSALASVEEIQEATAIGGRLKLLDTRNQMEFASGTIPGSIHVEWTEHLKPDGTFRPLEEIRALYRTVGIDDTGSDPVVTFCGSGYRAANSYVALKAIGVRSVKNYAPSWGEWSRRRDLPVEDPRRR